jgi:hypothetical protein
VLTLRENCRPGGFDGVNELDKDMGDKLTFARRVVIENVRPEIPGARFPIKRTIGEPVEVTADIYADGHDIVPPFCCTARFPNVGKRGFLLLSSKRI